MDLGKLVSTEKKTPEDNLGKRQQIAGMFQKLVKGQKDIETLTQIEDAFPTLLGNKFLLHPTDSIIRRRSAACIANMTSLETSRVHALLRQFLVLEALVQYLEHFGSLQTFCHDESALHAIQYVALAMLNMVLLQENRDYFANHLSTGAVGIICQSLSTFVYDDEDVHGSQLTNETVKDVVYNLMIVLSSLALDEDLCITMCHSGTSSDINQHHSSIDLACHVLLRLDEQYVDMTLLEACTALLWNNALNESTREDVSIRGGKELVARLVSISKSGDAKVRQNSSHVIQILSTTEVSQRHLLSDVNSLVDGLREDDAEEVINSAGTLWNVAKNVETRKKIEECKGDVLLMDRLKHFINRSTPDLNVIYKITGAMSTLTLSDSISLNLCKNGCIDYMFQILNSPKYQMDVSIMENALTVLNNVAILEVNRNVMRTRERIKFLVDYLEIPKNEMTEDKFRLAEKASNILTSMSIEDSGSKLIREVGGIERLIRLVRMQELRAKEKMESEQEFEEYDFSWVKKRATTVLWNLSLDDDNLKMIEDLNGIRPLVNFLPQTELDDKIFLNNVKKQEEEDLKYAVEDDFIDDSESFDAFTYAEETIADASDDEGEDDEQKEETEPAPTTPRTPDKSDGFDQSTSPIQIEATNEIAENSKSELSIPIEKIPAYVQPSSPSTNQKEEGLTVTTQAAKKETPRRQEIPKPQRVNVVFDEVTKVAIIQPTTAPAHTTKFIKHMKRWNHIKLLYESEREYIDLLAWMDQNFMASNSFIMKNRMIEEQAHADIFQDIDCLRLVNLDLFTELEKIYVEYRDCFTEKDESIMIGSIIIKRSPTLRLYKTYANNLKRAIDSLSSQLHSKASFREFIAKNETEFKQRLQRMDDFTKLLLFNTGQTKSQEVTSKEQVPVDIILQDLLLKKPIERVNFYTLWLEEMINVHTNFTHPDFKLLKEAHKQLTLINDYCVKKLQQLEQLEQFAKMLSEHPFSQKQKKYFLQKNVGFPEPSEFQSYNVWTRKYEKRLSKSYKAWSTYRGVIDSKSSVVRKMIKKYGIVPLMRPRVWMILSGAQRKMDENSGYYQKILQSSGKTITSKVVKEIEKDVKRTYPSHPFFEDETSPVFSAMRRIFIAYSTRNPLVNYSQSFNFICGLLLLHLSEEEAFWLFVSIIEDYLPQNFYSPTLKGVLVDASLLDELIYQNHSKLATHFKKLGFEVSTFTMAFLMKLYSSDFPVETTLRIWDKLFLDGGTVLFKVSLALLKMNESALLKAPDLSSLLLCFQNMVVKPCFDVDKLLKTAEKYDKKVTPQKVELLRKRYSALVDAELKKQEAMRN